MDIKDVSDFPAKTAEPNRSTRIEKPTTNGSETTRALSASSAEYDELRISIPTRTSTGLSKINDIIEATNLATEAVAKLGKMFSGIEQTLNVSANSADFEVVGKESSPRGPAAAGDSIRVELEETLGKTLEVILPSNVGAASGFDTVHLSPKDLILDTVAKVEAARKGIEELRSKLAFGIGTIQAALSALGSGSTSDTGKSARIRDMEQVWATARETHDEIRARPELALGVIGDIQRNAPALLR
jgi:hypothetical protein